MTNGGPHPRELLQPDEPMCLDARSLRLAGIPPAIIHLAHREGACGCGPMGQKDVRPITTLAGHSYARGCSCGGSCADVVPFLDAIDVDDRDFYIWDIQED